MADTVELAAGWIVAGLVTALGVILAHRFQERSRQRQEDRAKVYEPIRKEMIRLLQARAGDAIETARLYWTPSDEFEDIRHRGAIHPKRHDDLRNDIDRLRELHRQFEGKLSAFYDARSEATKVTCGGLVVKESNGPRSFSLIEIEGDGFHAQESLLRPLASGDKAGWERKFREILDKARSRTGGTEVEFDESPAALFDKTEETIRSVRAEYREAAEAFLNWAECVKGRLDSTLRVR